MLYICCIYATDVISQRFELVNYMTYMTNIYPAFRPCLFLFPKNPFVFVSHVSHLKTDD